jgi:hypothetical protein
MELNLFLKLLSENLPEIFIHIGWKKYCSRKGGFLILFVQILPAWEARVWG